MAALLLMGLLSALGTFDGVSDAPTADVEAAEPANAPALPVIGNPLVEPEEVDTPSIDPVTAVKLNAERPLTDRPNTPARPFRSRLKGDALERAISCLAVAALYEAGGDVRDQEAVMQVVLNRVRHPAFPNSVCRVVFQGSERVTGCQFTFTCDGALVRRRPRERAFAAARGLAAAMLDKRVDTRVGLATHYHTNWVLPYWSSSLDKVAIIKTHLFFRWQGYWGERVAFRQTPSPDEPAMRQLADMDPTHRTVEVATADISGADSATDPETDASASADAAAPGVVPLRLAVKPDTTPVRWGDRRGGAVRQPAGLSRGRMAEQRADRSARGRGVGRLPAGLRLRPAAERQGAAGLLEVR